MLHRLAVGLRRFFKFSSRKNRLPDQPFAQPERGQEGKEKISEGDKREPKGSQKFSNRIKRLDKLYKRRRYLPEPSRQQSPMSVLTGGLLK